MPIIGSPIDPPLPVAATRIFERVVIDHLVLGQTRVSWELYRHFRDIGPYEFQLQAGRTGAPDADDWVDVGAPATDVFELTDPDRRLHGRRFWTHYRVKLTSTVAVYFSQPAQVTGRLAAREWRQAREIMRKERLRHRQYTSWKGILLKRRVYGELCECTDPLTEEVRSQSCHICYGTGFVLGFFAPMPDIYMDVALESVHEDRNSTSPAVQPVVVPARFVGTPQLYENDLWIHESSDRRFYVHNVTSKAEIRGIPIVVEAQLRLIETSDPVYLIDQTIGPSEEP